MSTPIITGNHDDKLALPEFRLARPGTAVLEIHGAIGPLSVAGVAVRCRRLGSDDSIHRVILSIDSLAAVPDIDDAIYAIHRLTKEKMTLALIINSLGQSCRLAAATRAIFALPTARIGAFAAFEPGEEWTVQHEHDHATVDSLSQCRPDVQSWDRLLRGTVNGEQAEAMGVVDLLVRSESALIEKFSRKATT